MNRTPPDEAALDRLMEHDPAYVFERMFKTVQYCILNTHCNSGDCFINGPFATRTLAQAYAAGCAEESLAALRTDDPGVEYELDAEGDGDIVTISADGENEMEWSVYELIAPTPQGGPQ